MYIVKCFRYVRSQLENELWKTRNEKQKNNQRAVQFFLQNKKLQKQLNTMVTARQADFQQFQKLQKQLNILVAARQADLQQCQKTIEVITIEDLDEEDGSQ